MRIEIVSTGDEVITGSIDDTNASFLSRELMLSGLEVNRRHTAGDSLRELVSLFNEIAERQAVVLVTGGLGPTSDDLTAQAAATSAKVDLELHREWVCRMRQYFQEKGRIMTESNMKQAMLPQGCMLVNNPVGTACGFAMKIRKAVFVFAPGVPKELKAMWEESIRDMVLSLAGDGSYRRMCVKKCVLMGIGESALADLLKRIDLPKEITFGDRAVFPLIELKLVGRGAASHVIEGCYAAIYGMLERYAVNRTGSDFNRILHEHDVELPGIALIDSVTGGMISLELRRLNIPVLSSLIINRYEESLPEIEREFAQRHGNRLTLKRLDRPEEGKTGALYALSFSLELKDGGKKREIECGMTFDFATAPEAHLASERHLAFVTMLTLIEIFKIIVGEKLLVPDECAVEVQSLKDLRRPREVSTLTDYKDQESALLEARALIEDLARDRERGDIAGQDIAG